MSVKFFRKPGGDPGGEDRECVAHRGEDASRSWNCHSGAPRACRPRGGTSIRQKQEYEDALGANLSQGDYYYYNGNWGKALSFYRRVMELDSRQVSVLVRVAQIYEQIDDPVKARAMWERVLTLQADNAEARKHLQKLGR